MTDNIKAIQILLDTLTKISDDISALVYEPDMLKRNEIACRSLASWSRNIKLHWQPK